ncbi:MAG: FAD-binding protein [Bilophila wadsworthia]
MIPVKPVIEADLLIVGGGIGGLMAGIAAGKAGCKNVVIMEKCHARRSGSGATGNDHFNCYIPSYHGDDIEPVFKETMQSLVGQLKEPSLMHKFLEKSFELVQMWDAWGVNMRPTGDWECKGHALPGKPRAFLKYDGSDQKKVLVREAKAVGVKFYNHHPVVELARVGGRIAGALAVDISTEQPAFVPVRAKTVLLATGLTHRLYMNASTPGFMFNTGHCPNCAGGQGLGWRVGARMVNMEFPYTHAGPKYLQRCGKATWIGVYRYPDGKPIGPFATKSDPQYGDVTSDIWNSVFEDVMRKGTGPAYMDCSDATDEQMAYMRWAMTGEGLTALLTYWKRKGSIRRSTAWNSCATSRSSTGAGSTFPTRAKLPYSAFSRRAISWATAAVASRWRPISDGKAEWPPRHRPPRSISSPPRKPNPSGSAWSCFPRSWIAPKARTGRTRTWPCNKS